MSGWLLTRCVLLINNYIMEMPTGPSWGKKEMEKLLADLRSKGQFEMRQEILRTIKRQERELVGYEVQMVSGFLMCITALVGLVVRRATTRYLE